MNQIKHIFLIVIAMLPCRAMMAQDYLLDHYYSDDGVDRVQFYYNANNLLESYHSTTNMGGEIEDYIDTLMYDERGNVVRVNFYQFYDNEWIFPSYVTYTYDDNNHRLTRTNYNDWGSGFELQGVYTYSYDGDLPTNYEMTLGGTLLMRGTYTYDAEGRCTQCLEEYNDAWGGTGWSNSALTSYTYDGAGNCTNETYSYWSNGWVPDSSIERLFDTKGNCLQREKRSNGQVVDRVSYTYDEECTINHVLLPYHPEPVYNEMTLSLEGLHRYEIIDMNGQTVMQGLANSKLHTINISGLASGLYLVKAYNGQRWSVCKVQVR